MPSQAEADHMDVSKPLLPPEDHEQDQNQHIDAPSWPSPSSPLADSWALGEKQPFGFVAESRRVVSLALPVTASSVLSFLSYLITTAQVGAIDSDALSAITLGRTIFHITGLSLVIGLASGVSTLAGQAYGAGQAPLVSAVTQRALLLNLFLSGLVLIGWTQAEPLMVWLGQDPEISRMAARYVRCISPALVMEAVLSCLHNHLMCQGIVNPLTAVAAVCTVATPIVNYLFIQVLDLGLEGVASAFNIIMSLNVILVAMIVFWVNPAPSRNPLPEPSPLLSPSPLLDPEIPDPQPSTPPAHRVLRTSGQHWTWSWSLACSGWGQYLRVALPSLAMICADWWCFEAMILVAGRQADAHIQLAVMGILFSTHSLAFFFNEGFSEAATTRVSNLLGAGAVDQARGTTMVCLALSVSCSTTCAVTIMLGRSPWAALFSADTKVHASTVAALPWLALSLVADGCGAVLTGVLRGAGRQGLGFAANLVAFWLLGLPLAWWWGASKGAVGMWMAMAVVSGLQALGLGLAVTTFNWRREAELASHNVHQGRAILTAHLPQDGDVRGEAVPGLLPRYHGAYDP